MNSETPIMNHIRLRVGGRADCRLFRNNVGCLQDKYGAWIPFGLAPGSSDLIGWRSVVVTPGMVGKQLAIFTALEVKVTGGRTDPKRLDSQKLFLAAVIKAGGLAGFVHSPEEAERVVDAL